MTQDDFAFAWQGAGTEGWSRLRVAHFNGREAMSELSRYEITVAEQISAPRIAVDDLVGERATLRVATLSQPGFKVVHGVVLEGQELEPSAHARIYRLVLSPRWVRSRFEVRSRIFLDKTIRQIVDAVLEKNTGMTRDDGLEIEPDGGELDYRPAREAFAWRVADASRIDDARARPYVVQYEESDFDFVSRLLEEEGIAYHFEDGAGVSLLVLSDKDTGLAHLHPKEIGASIPGREVANFRAGGRLRTNGVELGDYEWRKPRLDMATGAHENGREDLVVKAFPGGYYDSPAKGAMLAKAQLDRFAVEATYARGEGGIRVLSAGEVISLEHEKARNEGEYVITALSVRGEQHGIVPGASDPQLAGKPFRAWFECARRGTAGHVEESRFRPERRTPRPKIFGTQTAVVTADPQAAGAEVHVGGPDGLSVGCVRVRFHWDKEADRLGKEPSSTWVRVSQPFAGIGEGGVWHPRVGVEVIVDFEEGDPDRPLVTGRVYNGANLPPYGGTPNVSTFKSFATPGGAVHNEYTFTDTGGSELIYVNAGKDMTTNVGNDRTETIAAAATMTVGVNNTETVGANHTLSIGVNDTCTIGANDSNAVGANSVTSIGANCVLSVGGNQVKEIGAGQEITISGTHTETIGATVTESYGASHDLTVTGAVSYSISADRTVTIGGSHSQTFGPHCLQVGGNRTVTAPTLTTTTNGVELELVGGNYDSTVGGAFTGNVSGGIFYITPAWQVVPGHGAHVDSNKLSITVLSLTGLGFEAVNAGSASSITGASISATGVSASFTGNELSATAVDICLSGPRVEEDGLQNNTSGIVIFL